MNDVSSIKPCKKCGGSDRYSSGKCRLCVAAYYKLNTEQCRLNSKKQASRANPKRRALNKKIRDLRVRYGLSLVEYDCMALLQDNKCAICRRDQRKTWSVDHDHMSGAVRGLLCQSCNTAIGLLGDDPDVVQSAELYLRGFPIQANK